MIDLIIIYSSYSIGEYYPLLIMLTKRHHLDAFFDYVIWEVQPRVTQMYQSAVLIKEKMQSPAK